MRKLGFKRLIPNNFAPYLHRVSHKKKRSHERSGTTLIVALKKCWINCDLLKETDQFFFDNVEANWQFKRITSTEGMETALNCNKKAERFVYNRIGCLTILFKPGYVAKLFEF